MAKAMYSIQDTTNQAGARKRVNIQPLLADLASKNGLVRARAREILVSTGGEAVMPLIAMLQDQNWHARWEAAKALREIGDPQAALPLVGALEDVRSGIRWLAAEGLIMIGCEALPPLLQALTHRSDSEWLREGAHHVFRAWLQEKERPVRNSRPDEATDRLILPVFKALEGVEPVIETPRAAQTALDAWNCTDGK